MKKKKGINLLFSILLSVACFLTGFNSLGGFKDLFANAAIAAVDTNVSVNIGDTVYFGEYPNSYIPESDTQELVKEINKLKNSRGLNKWFNSDGTSKITYTGDTSLSTDASKVLVGEFTLDGYCQTNGTEYTESDAISYNTTTGYFTLKKDLGSLQKGEKVKEFTTGTFYFENRGSVNSEFSIAQDFDGGVSKESFNYYSAQAGETDKVYYFKVEPIEWIVVSVNESTKQAELVSKYALDSNQFNYTDGTQYNNSTLRFYLNGLSGTLYNTTSSSENTFNYNYRSFINSAFSASEQAALVSKTISEPLDLAYYNPGPSNTNGDGVTRYRYYNSSNSYYANNVSSGKPSSSTATVVFGSKPSGYTQLTNSKIAFDIVLL